MHDDDAISQRIRYLVEHGGLYDDPIAEAKRTARAAMWLALVSFGLDVVQLAVTLHH